MLVVLLHVARVAEVGCKIAVECLFIEVRNTRASHLCSLKVSSALASLVLAEKFIRLFSNILL